MEKLKPRYEIVIGRGRGKSGCKGTTLEAIAVGGARDGDLNWSDRYGDGKMWLG